MVPWDLKSACLLSHCEIMAIIGESRGSFKTAPKMKVCIYILILIPKKMLKKTCTDPNPVNHLKDLRAGVPKFWEFSPALIMAHLGPK